MRTAWAIVTLPYWLIRRWYYGRKARAGR